MAEEEFTQMTVVQEAKDAHETELLAKTNVVGVGIGYKEKRGKILSGDGPVVQVYVREKLPKTKLSSDEMVAAEVDGAKTDVVEVGDVEAQPFTARLRPAIPGYSIGHYQITAGTFGCLVRDICEPCHVHILSNNHVLANSNAAAIGDPILQPGRVDGGTIPNDVIARLSRFVPIRFGDPARFNLVDAALARQRDQRDVIASITGLGIPTGTVEATLGLDVVKSGRTTETTTGQVIGLNATIAVGFGVGVAYFRNQILTTNMSAGGDSGSLLLSRAERKATGLLFAGSSQVTVHNNISNVLMALGVELITA